MDCRIWEIQILRHQEGELPPESEAALLRHLEICARCRNTAEKFSEIDHLLLELPAPDVPPFLQDRIVSRVIEAIREESSYGNIFGWSAYFRPALAGIILAAGIGLGVLMGMSLSHSVSTGSRYDVLALSGIETGQRRYSLDFIWTDTGGGGQ